MNELIDQLLKLDFDRSGKRNTDHEKRRLYQWVFDECKLRWSGVKKREVWEAIQECENRKEKLQSR